MTNSIVTQDQKMAALSADVETEVKQVTRKLMRLAPGGRRLNSEQAVDLAVYALMTGFNPFEGECYYMDRVGPTVGIEGLRRKAVEQMQIQTGNPERIWFEERKATLDEANFDPDKGDIAWYVTMHTSVSKSQWLGMIVEMTKNLTEAGIPSSDAMKAASDLVGPEPTWSAVGVVGGQEKFAADGKQEMWDRNERALKRAKKNCLREAFSNLSSIPDTLGEAEPVVSYRIIERIKDEVEEEEAPAPDNFNEHEALQDLGFEPDVIEEGEYQDVENIDHGADIYPTVTDSKGVPYKDKGIQDLSFSFNGLNKKIKQYGDDLTDEQAEELSELQLKRDAAHYYINQKKEAQGE